MILSVSLLIANTIVCGKVNKVFKTENETITHVPGYSTILTAVTSLVLTTGIVKQLSKMCQALGTHQPQSSKVSIQRPQEFQP